MVTLPTQLTLSSIRSVQISEHSHLSIPGGGGQQQWELKMKRKERKEERTFLTPLKTACSKPRSHLTVLIQLYVLESGEKRS